MSKNVHQAVEKLDAELHDQCQQGWTITTLARQFLANKDDHTDADTHMISVLDALYETYNKISDKADSISRLVKS